MAGASQRHIANYSDIWSVYCLKRPEVGGLQGLWLAYAAGTHHMCNPAHGQSCCALLCVLQVPLAVSRPVATPDKKAKKSGYFGKGRTTNYLAGPANPVLPPQGSCLADIVLQAGDRVLLQVSKAAPFRSPLLIA